MHDRSMSRYMYTFRTDGTKKFRVVTVIASNAFDAKLYAKDRNFYMYEGRVKFDEYYLRLMYQTSKLLIQGSIKYGTPYQVPGWYGIKEVPEDFQSYIEYWTADETPDCREVFENAKCVPSPVTSATPANILLIAEREYQTYLKSKEGDEGDTVAEA